MTRGGVIALALVMGLVALTGPPRGGAIQAACAAEDSRVPLPAITKGKGESCVAETGFMRRNHMNLLGHQRDETTREGIRTTRFSLKKCVDCHAVPGADGKPVGAEDPRFFCTACHEYVAVKIDCFQCHASRPETPSRAGLREGFGGTAALSMIGKDWR